MAIQANVKIDAGIVMPVYIRILSVDGITNHKGGGESLVTIRGFLKSLVDSDEYTDFKGDNPPPYCWGGESGMVYKVNIDVSDTTKSIYQQAYDNLLDNDDFMLSVSDAISV